MNGSHFLGSARVSRAGDGVFAIANFLLTCDTSSTVRRSHRRSWFRRGAETNTRDACATQSPEYACRD